MISQKKKESPTALNHYWTQRNIIEDLTSMAYEFIKFLLRKLNQIILTRFVVKQLNI